MALKKTLIPTLLLVALPLSAQAQDSPAKYRDKNRVLLVFAPSRSDGRWQRQEAMLRGSQGPFQDRELRRINVFETPYANKSTSLRWGYGVRVGSFHVFLIGKDGNVAYSSLAPVSLRTLTATIDRMPMRRDEMRRKGEL